MADPSRVLVAGDWHGNAEHAVGVIELLPELLPDQPRIVLHAGDFGIWPGPAGRDYVDDVAIALNEADAFLWFVDGNHEDGTQLADAFTMAGQDRTRRIGGWESWGVPQRISWLPRGHRWTWHGRTWLALGGATSVDRAVRVPGRSWWPGEALSMFDVEAAVAPGPVDVVLAHDAPAKTPLNLSRPAPTWWDIATADRHRVLVQEVVDAVAPWWWIHGHYHPRLAHQTVVPMSHGDVQVTGLGCDGEASNYRVLDVRTMAWEAHGG